MQIDPLLQGGDSPAEVRRRLVDSPWLQICSADFREALLDRAIIRRSPAGARLFHAGDEGGGMFGIATGTVEIALHLPHPDASIVHLAHGGFWAGHRPLLGRPRGIGVVARTDVVWALVPQHQVQAMLEERPGWWRFIARLADDSAETAISIVADLTRQDSRQRAIAALLRLAGCRYRDPPQGSSVELRLSQSELAAIAVMSRNTLNSIMRDLVEARLIAVGYRSVLLRDPARLRAVLTAAD